MRRRLLCWYDGNRRSLPWREKPSPYRTWISEIMLQQTQVATVLPYYRRFLRRFPTARALAAAPEEEVLRLWAGLGYYSRARSLLRAAAQVAADHGGRLPADLESLRRLPGIGPYTAAAIASIAFGLPHELVDGNVARVLARLGGRRGDVKSPALSRELWKDARGLLDRRRPGDWNQALMELGALVCLPHPPRCGACPLKTDCSAFRHGLQDDIPKTSASRAPVLLEWTGLDIRKNGRRLLWRRAREERFLRGLWGLPERRHLKTARTGALLRTVRHSITHHRITLKVYAAELASRTKHRGRASSRLSPARLPAAARWVPQSALKSYLVSSLWRKATKTKKPS